MHVVRFSSPMNVNVYVLFLVFVSKCWRPYVIYVQNARVSCWKYITTFDRRWHWLMPHLNSVGCKRKSSCWWIDSCRSCISWKLLDWMGRENAQVWWMERNTFFILSALQKKAYFLSAAFSVSSQYFLSFSLYTEFVYFDLQKSLRIVQCETTWAIALVLYIEMRSSIVNIFIRKNKFSASEKCQFVDVSQGMGFD